MEHFFKLNTMLKWDIIDKEKKQRKPEQKLREMENNKLYKHPI